MALWAVAYDLDVKGMRDAGYTAGQVTTFYKAVRDALAGNQFEKFAQLSIYTSATENTLTHAFAACMDLSAIPDSDKFIKRLHLYRVEDMNDLLPLVAKGKKSSDTDAVEEKIKEVFGADAATTAENGLVAVGAKA